MPDNVAITPGAGAVIATDERDDGSQVQWVKIAYGDNGAFLPITADSPLPVATNLEDALDAVIAAVDAARAALPQSPETGLAKDSNLTGLRGQLPTALDASGGLKTFLVNPPASPETGLAKDATVAAIRDRLPALLSGGGVSVTLTNPPSDAATQTTLAAVLAKLSSDPATQTTLAAVLSKLSADPSTGSKQDAQEATLTAIEGTLDTIATEATLTALETLVGTLATDASVSGLQDLLTTLTGKDFATNAKLTAIETLLTSINSNVATEVANVAQLEISDSQIQLNTDGLEALLTTLTNKDFATQTTLAAAKAVLDSLNSKDFATQTTLAAVLSKLSSDPATQTTLAAVLAKLTSDPSTATLQTAIRDRLPVALDASGGLKVHEQGTAATDPIDRAGRLLGVVDTELPAAVALSDTLGNPTSPIVGSAALVWNNTNWVRQYSPFTDGFSSTGGFAAVGPMLYNGTTWDRARSVPADGSSGIGFQAIVPEVFNGATFERVNSAAAVNAGGVNASGALPALGMVYVTAVGARLLVAPTVDAAAGANIAPSGMQVYNGATWDRVRTANTANGSNPAGVLGAGLLGWDATNTVWRRVAVSATGVQSIDGTVKSANTYADGSGDNGDFIPVGNRLWNGATWDKMRSVPAADAQAGTGLHPAVVMGWNGTTYDRIVSDASKRLGVTATINGTSLNHSADGLALGGFAVPGMVLYAFNGSTIDRVKAGAPGDGVGGTGRLNAISMLWNGGTFDMPRSSAIGDAVATGVPLVADALYNGTNQDRARSTLPGPATTTSAARTSTLTGATTVTFNLTKIVVVLNVTVASGTGGLQVLIEGLDPLSGNFYAMNATPTTVTTTGQFVYELFPGAGAASGGVTQRTSGMLPRSVRYRVVHGDASSYTYSVNMGLAV